MKGAGKYDQLCTAAREQAGAVGCILIVFGGVRGSGFSVQMPGFALDKIPETLRNMADVIERDAKELSTLEGPPHG